MKEAITKYLESIKMSDYSIIMMNAINEVSIQTNMSYAWKKEFIRRKLYIYSDILIKAKNRITPFLWKASDTNNQDIKILSEKYNIQKGVSFTIKIRNEIIVFTIYFNDNTSLFTDFYNANREKILYDVMNLFEQHYRKNNKYFLTCREKEVMENLKWEKPIQKSELFWASVSGLSDFILVIY